MVQHPHVAVQLIHTVQHAVPGIQHLARAAAGGLGQSLYAAGGQIIFQRKSIQAAVAQISQEQCVPHGLRPVGVGPRGLELPQNAGQGTVHSKVKAVFKAAAVNHIAAGVQMAQGAAGGDLNAGGLAQGRAVQHIGGHIRAIPAFRCGINPTILPPAAKAGGTAMPQGR